MTTTPTLPGTLPGLLQPGAPVIWLDCADGDEPCRAWMVAPVDSASVDGKSPDTPADSAVVVLLGDYDTSTILLSRLALDLSRPEGVDRALRWLMERAPNDIGVAAMHIIAYLGNDPAERAANVEKIRLACLAVGEAT